MPFPARARLSDQISKIEFTIFSNGIKKPETATGQRASTIEFSGAMMLIGR